MEFAKALRPTRRAFIAGTAGVLAAPLVSNAQTEVREVRIAKQFGISYLPLMIMEELRLVEKHAAGQGLPNVRTNWLQFAGGAPINDALISGSLEFAGGGVGPMITLWARTRGNLGVRGVAALNAMPLYLNTVNPNVRTIRDFTDRDRIGLPAVRVSIQAVTLQMACEAAFGQGQHGRLDNITVSMGHPDAMNAMMSGRSEITAHFGSPPFQNQQLQDARVRRVLSNYEVLGGPASFNFMWTTSRVRDNNPRIYRAFVAALEEAQALIRSDASQAADIYLKVERAQLPKEFVLGLLRDPEHQFKSVPLNTMKYAEFMQRTGTVAVRPSGWQEMFFQELHNVQGS